MPNTAWGLAGLPPSPKSKPTNRPTKSKKKGRKTN